MGVLVVHGGAGSTDDVADGVEAALEAGLRTLGAGGDAVEAVVRAVVVMEDDPRFNAGTGSRLTLEGRAEMDASLMDSRGACGAVAILPSVRNPILVARRVLDGPHVLLAGDGALRYARKEGFPEYDPVTEEARRRLDEAKRRLVEGELPPWAERWRSHGGVDTVGAVARDDEGYMAAANSTGGVSIQLPGRVGDTPVIGAGLFAGPAGAVTATGIGEEIVRRVLSKEVYDALASGRGSQEACQEAVDRFPAAFSVGLLAVDPGGWGAASNRSMAWARGETEGRHL